MQYDRKVNHRTQIDEMSSLHLTLYPKANCETHRGSQRICVARITFIKSTSGQKGKWSDRQMKFLLSSFHHKQNSSMNVVFSDSKNTAITTRPPKPLSKTRLCFTILMTLPCVSVTCVPQQLMPDLARYFAIISLWRAGYPETVTNNRAKHRAWCRKTR